MFSNLAYTLLGITDMVIMGRVGVAEVGAVGFGSLSVLTMILLLRGTLQTVTTFVGRALGAGDTGGVRRWYGVYLGLTATGFLLTLAGPALLGLLFDLLRPDPTVRDLAQSYATIRMLEAPLSLVTVVNVGLLIALGNSRAPAVLAWVAVIANAAFTAGLVFGAGMGIEGAAWGTVAAVALQAVASIWMVQRLYAAEYGPLRPVIPTGEELRAVGRVGVPAGLTELGEVSAFTAFQGIVSRLGPLELTASQVANGLASFGFLPAFALASATGSLVARALGAGDPVLARRVGWRGTVLGAVFMASLALTFVTIPEVLIRLFTDAPEVVPLGIVVLRVMAVFQVFDGIAIVLGGVLGGAGDTRFRMIVTLVGAWGVMVPLAGLLAPRWGVMGAWMAALIFIVLAALAYLWRFAGRAWLRARL